MKDKILILTIILSISCLIIAIQASHAVKQNKGSLDQERYQRIVTEEVLQKAQMKVRSLENELINARNQVQGIQAILEKEKLANKNLSKELEKVVKLNDILEKELKGALVD